MTYADDIVIYKANERHETGFQVQRALNLIVDKISDIGLKVSELKTKCLFFHPNARKPQFNLTINDLPIEWVPNYKYLGVYLDVTLSFVKHANHVASKAQKRIDAMKVMSSLSGVDMSVLKQVYITTVRPILEYGSQVLSVASKKALTIIKVSHNKALRLVLGVPKNTAIDAVESELRLPPLNVRFSTLTAHFVAKVYSNQEHPLHNTFVSASKKDPRVYDIKASHIMTDLLQGSSLPHIQPKFVKIAPWKNHPIQFKIYHPYKSKSTLTQRKACQMAKDQIALIEQVNDHIYYTDGSVSNFRASSAFYTEGFSKSVRLKNNTTILQAELYAIKMALEHSNHQGEDRVIIHTDSLSSIQLLSRRNPRDNIDLVNSIFHMSKNKAVSPIINWVPSHTGIFGNEAADKEASLGLYKEITVDIPTSLSATRNFIKEKALSNWQIFKENDPQATERFKWNQKLTHNIKERKAISKLPRFIQKVISRLRVHAPPIRFTEFDCVHCGHITNQIVSHYISQCPVTKALRRRLFLSHIPVSDRNETLSVITVLILNRQAERLYRELVQFIQQFDYI